MNHEYKKATSDIELSENCWLPILCKTFIRSTQVLSSDVDCFDGDEVPMTSTFAVGPLELKGQWSFDVFCIPAYLQALGATSFHYWDTDVVSVDRKSNIKISESDVEPRAGICQNLSKGASCMDMADSQISTLESFESREKGDMWRYMRPIRLTRNDFHLVAAFWLKNFKPTGLFFAFRWIRKKCGALVELGL